MLFWKKKTEEGEIWLRCSGTKNWEGWYVELKILKQAQVTAEECPLENLGGVCNKRKKPRSY
jgi:hypothetical protein